MAADVNSYPYSLSLQRQQNPRGDSSCLLLWMCPGVGPGAYQDLGFHSWPVDEVGLLVDHDRFGDCGHAGASWRLWAWAKCLQGLV